MNPTSMIWLYLSKSSKHLLMMTFFLFLVSTEFLTMSMSGKYYSNLNIRTISNRNSSTNLPTIIMNSSEFDHIECPQREATTEELSCHLLHSFMRILKELEIQRKTLLLIDQVIMIRWQLHSRSDGRTPPDFIREYAPDLKGHRFSLGHIKCT